MTHFERSYRFAAEKTFKAIVNLISYEKSDLIILLCMDYDIAFWLEKMKAERSKRFHGKTSRFLFFSISF